MTPLVKICGLNSVEALDAALSAGADLVGFVRYPRSPRHLGLDEAGTLSGRAKGKALRVALTVDASDEELSNIVAATRSGHPPAPRRRGAGARRRDPGPLRPAGDEGGRHRRGRATSPLSSRYAEVADRLLLDAKPPKNAEALPGGNGLAFDWRLVAGLDPALAVMLSGGLDARERRRGDRAQRARGRSTSPPASNDGRAKRTRRRSRRFVRAARAAWAGLDKAKDKVA